MNREKLKAEEAEQDQRNKLIKSRPKKDDDPEREKKKKDAKMKNEALQEREQQKRADMTALAATQRKRNPNNTNVSNLFLTISQFLERILMEYIEKICSLKYKLFFDSIYSIQNRSRNQDIIKNCEPV